MFYSKKSSADSKAHYFPLFVDLKDQYVLVVGGGVIATRRITVLLDFTDHIFLVSPDISDTLTTYHNANKISYQQKKFTPDDLNGASLVLAATDNIHVNNEIVRLCKDRHILVNHAGDQQQCDFYFPGIIRQDNLVVGVTASGQHHAMAKTATDQIKELLEVSLCYNDQDD